MASKGYKICDDINPKKEAREFMTTDGPVIVLMCQQCCDNPIYNKLQYRKVEPDEVLDLMLKVG